MISSRLDQFIVTTGEMVSLFERIAERQVLNLPRPLFRQNDKQVALLLSVSVANILVGAYRRIGKRSHKVHLYTSGIFVVPVAYELAARKIERRELEAAINRRLDAIQKTS